jgi:ATP adenylyltransferase
MNHPPDRPAPTAPDNPPPTGPTTAAPAPNANAPAPTAPQAASQPSAHPTTSAQAPALFAPWRLSYLESLDEPPKGAPVAPAADGSFLGAYWRNPANDDANLVIWRDAAGMILLNRYPYANGHLLVALGEARPRLLDYAPDQRAALWRLVDHAAKLMELALQPQGINIGINQGRAAGAGVPTHLHAHLVPRWGGDVNFMTAVAQVRVIPSSLEAMADRYRRVLHLADQG